MQTVSLVSNLLALITSNMQTYSCSESKIQTAEERKVKMTALYCFIFRLILNSECLGSICIPSRSILSCIDHKVAPLREPDNNLRGETEQLADRSIRTLHTWTFNHRSVLPDIYIPTSLGVSVSSFSTKHNGSTDGTGRGCRPSRLPDVLK